MNPPTMILEENPASKRHLSGFLRYTIEWTD
jgi:hypothetical protein